LAAGERRMLEMAAAAVRPGGRLVYATCSSEPEENAGVVEAFLAADRSFSLTTPASVSPTLVDERGYFRTLPFQHDLDAFFGAVLARRPGT
jgi:16S rRNA (cytosine967-C5)-methyltransferase